MIKHVFSGSPEAMGEAHGSLFASEIAALAELRSELTMGRSDLETRAELTELARAHLPVLADFDASLHAELLAISAASCVSPEALVVLNNYTDLRDIRRSVWGRHVAQDDPGGCSSILQRGAGGHVVTGQTWDMHGSAAPFVRLVELRPDGGPAATVLTLTGCLALAGLNEHGVAVLINNLTSTDAQVGVLWGAVVRAMLRARTAREAMGILWGSRLGSGHHYVIADPSDAFAIETSGLRKLILQKGAQDQLLHTNHCLVGGLLDVEDVPDFSTTYVRMEHLERRAALLPEAPSAEQIAGAFRDHEGHPRSLCIHVTAEGNPHAVDTCGGIAVDLEGRRVLAVQGCVTDGEWVETVVGSDDVTSIPEEALRIQGDTAP